MALHIIQPNIMNNFEPNYLTYQEAQQKIHYLSENQILLKLHQFCYGENHENMDVDQARQIAIQYFNNGNIPNNVVENELIQNQYNEINNIDNFFDFNYKQYLIRYYIYRGEYNNIVNILENILDDNEYNIAYFLNYRHPHFQLNTILHELLLWFPNIELIQYIYQHGAVVHLVNENNYFPEEHIHNTPWYNPFYRFYDFENAVFLFTNQNGEIYYRDVNQIQDTVNYVLQLAGEVPVLN